MSVPGDCTFNHLSPDKAQFRAASINLSQEGNKPLSHSNAPGIAGGAAGNGYACTETNNTEKASRLDLPLRCS